MNVDQSRSLIQGSFAAGLVLALAAVWPGPARSQTLSSFDRDRGHVILKTIKNEIKKSYYDPTFRGIDLDARFTTADGKVDQATSIGQIFGIIAQVLIEFDDSHLFFIPPSRAGRSDYGWQWQAIGDKCYVVAVKPGSNAEAKGLHPGDQVISIDNYQPSRENVWKLEYLYNALRPQPGMRVTVQSPDGGRRQLDVEARIVQRKRFLDLTSDSGHDLLDLVREGESEDRLLRQRYYEVGDDLLIWKMPMFNLSEFGVDEMMDKAKKRKALILDLRGNPGGYEETLKRLLGHFFDHEVKVGDIKRRKETKPLLANSRGAFTGKLIVLVDSKSASSAEIFARTIQLEKRGTVIGDRSAGAVMRAIGHTFQTGADTVVLYGVSVTDADLIMTDGKSLERSGVTPDELSLPTAEELAAKQDTVLSRAAALAGVKLDPEKAGAMFPIEWRK